MRSFLAALLKEGVISIVVLILLCLLVWFGGEYLKTEDNDLFKERILIIAILIGIFMVLFIVQKVLAVRSAVRIEQQLKAQSGSQLEGADADKKAEIEALSKTFNESLEALKKTKGGKSALFTLPWYIIIGPPGSGKTTALQESGLNFPAVQGGAKVRGIGGTRNCDWWFTEDGILLDTAGRYTTVAQDQEEWFAFLEMIRTSRKDKPINGAIVAIATDELFRATDAELDQMAKDVRNRLDELSARLQAVFPVYMMFTKCDLVQGFAEFYEDFNKEQRGQVWGFTFPYSLPDKQYTEIFSEQVSAMGRNIQARQLDLLATERPPQKKQNIYLFPRQFALAAEKMKEFLGLLFHANAFQESAVLRGIYFTSGTQKGTPIDQILARMGEAMGIKGSQDGAEERVEKKSYFIHNLFTKVIFHDRTLARSSSKVIRKRLAIRLTLQIASLMALALMSWVLIASFYANHEVISKVEAAGANVKEMHAHEDPHLEDLQALESLRRELAALDAYNQDGRPVGMSFGMYQGDTMFKAGGKLYFDRLRPVYVEPAKKRVEDELGRLVASIGSDSPSADYDRLLELWKVYRMLCGKLPAKPEILSIVMKKGGLWSGSVRGKDAEAIENLAGEQLEFYALQLSRTNADSDPFELFFKLDPQLDERASVKLQGGLWPVSRYESVIQHTSSKRKPLTLEELVPENSQYLELRTDNTGGTNLSRLNAFTQEAWDTDIRELLNSEATALADLYVELGIDKNAEQIREELYTRHRSKQIDVWNDVLKNVHPKPGMFMDDFNQDHVKKTNEALSILVSDQSPIRSLIQSVWKLRQLTLEAGDEIPGADDAELKALQTAMDELSKFSDAYNAFWTTNRQKNQRFMLYKDSPEALDTLSAQFRKTAQELPKPFPTRDESVKQFLLRVPKIGYDSLKAEADAEVRSRWQNGVVSLWNRSFKGNYPFNPKSKQGVSMVNFSHLFNPKDGTLWNVHSRLKALEGVAFQNGWKLVSTSREYEQTIELASAITKAMFATEKDTMVKVVFNARIEPVGLMNGYELDIGTDAEGTPNTIKWNDRNRNSKDFSWEQFSTGSSKMGVRITTFAPVQNEQKKQLPQKDLFNDDWGLLRILGPDYATERKEVKVGDAPTYRCIFAFYAYTGQPYELVITFTPLTGQNPFRENLFTDFSMTEEVSK